MLKTRLRAAMLALIVIATTLSGLIVPLSPASATNDLMLTSSGPATVLVNSPSTFTVDLTATNPLGGSPAANGYNGSYRVVLPSGVSLASSNPASTSSVAIAGGTVVLFTNIGDIQEGSDLSLSMNLTASAAAHPVGSTITIPAGFYASEDPRDVPDFNGANATASGDFDGSATTSFTTEIVPIDIEKTSPTVGAEDEMLRGLHDQVNTYHLDVTNNGVANTDIVLVDDYLPANLEFLGCGGVDNTIDAPTNVGSPLEYPGAPALTATAAPAGPCPAAALVEMVTIASGVITSATASNGSIAPTGIADGVYTHIVWDLGTMTPSQLVEIEYQVAAPILENVYVATMNTDSGTSDPTANLDNNSGPHTNETVGEQSARNWATAGGDYTGPVAFPAAANASDVDDYLVTLEDLSIHKSVAEPGTVLHGSVANYTLLVETGEYRSVSNMTIVDTIPDGLCPLGATGCSAGSPSPAFTSAVEASDGTWAVQWDFSTVGGLSALGSNSSTTLTYAAEVLESYQEGFADDAPVNGDDGFSNTVTINGFKDLVLGSPDISADNNGDDGMQIFDESSASFAAGTPNIDKSVSTPTAPGVTLDCDAATWVRTDAAGAASPSAPATLVGEPYAYRPGDRVCYRLGIDLETALNYRNPRVDDFLPADYTFEQFWGASPTNGATGSNDVVINAVTNSGDLITWDLGEIDPDAAGGPYASDLFINNAATRFEVIFSAIVGGPSNESTPDIVSNLQKFTSSNIDGDSVSLRDSADVQVVQPHLIIAKSDGGLTEVQANDPVPHTVTVTNDFSATSASSATYDAAYATAVDIDSWDLLPDQISCSDLVSFNAAEPNPTGITLDVAGTVDWCRDNIVGTRSVISWTVDSLVPGAAAVLGYSYTIPAGIGFAETLTNNTGIRQYTGTGSNNANPAQAYIPGTGTNNIDTSLTPNIGDALATTDVFTPGLTVTKEHQSQEANSAANIANATLGTGNEEATIGELIQYRIRGTVPADVAVYDARLGDAFPSNLVFDSFISNTLYLYDGDAGTAATGAGFSTSQSGQTVELVFPASYIAGGSDGPGGGTNDDDTIELVVQLRVVDSGVNTTGDTFNNSAAFVAAKELSGSTSQVNSSQVTTTIVEPNPQVTKTARNAGNVIVGDVSAGETITYTLQVTNPSGAPTDNTSNAYDVVVTDVLPEGVTLTGGASGGVFTPDAGPTEGTLVWNTATTAALADIAPGATVTITYDVIVDDPAISADELINTVTVTATSLAATPTGERTTYSDSDSTTLDLPDATLTKDEANFGGVDIQNYEVGNTADFQLSVEVPAGTRIHGATIFDTLPSELAFDSYQAYTVNNCEVISSGLQMTTGDIVNLTTVDQTRGWYLGDIEARDGGGTPATCSIAVSYRAHVISAADTSDNPVNQSILGWQKTATVGAPPAAVSDLPAPPTDAVTGSWDAKTPEVFDDIDIIEPSLAVDKDVGLSSGPALANPGCDTTLSNNTGASNDSDGTLTNGCDIESGDRLTYSVAVSNSGDGAAYDIIMVDTVPVGLIPVDTATGTPVVDGANVIGSVVALPGVWNETARTITWTITSVPARAGGVDGVQILDYDVITVASDDLQDDEDLSNSIEIPTYYGLPLATRVALSNGATPTYGGARGSVVGDVVTVEVHFPDLAVTKAHSAPSDDTDAQLDQPFNWLLTVTNNDETATAFDLDAIDVLPFGWTYVPSSAVVTVGGVPGGLEPLTCSVGAPFSTCGVDSEFSQETLTWTDMVASLAPGASYTIAMQATPESEAITPDATNGIARTGWDGGSGAETVNHVNTIVITADDASGSNTCCDPDGPGGASPQDLNAFASDTVYVRRADLEVAKSVTPVEVDADPTNGPHWYGSFVEYTVNLTNDGPDPAVDVVVEDVLDGSNLIYNAVTQIDQGTFTQTGGAGAEWGEWNVGTVAPGDSLDLVIRVQIGTLATIDNLAEVTETSTYDPDSTPDNSGVAPTEDDTDSVQITSAPSMLGNYVWLDINNDGVQDPSEDGIPGITVSVTYVDPITSATVTDTTITDALGNYGFGDLPTNVPLTVEIDYTNLGLNPNLSGLVPSFDLDGGLNQSVITTIDPTSDADGFGTPGRLDVDFGFDPGAPAASGQSLGNRVWWDQDDSADDTDGVGEVGIANVTITAEWAGFDGIFGNADDQTYVTDTDATGTYLFDSIPPGEYRVSLDSSDLPDGLTTATYDLDGIPSLHSVSSITIASDEEQLDVDFSYRGNGSIGDTVWYDLDGDGIQDTDEFGIGGVTVTLDWTEPVSGATGTLTTTTDANGEYLFDNLPYGNFDVTIDGTTLPAGLVQTFDSDGLASPLVSSVTLSVADANDLDQDFGFRGAGTIGDTIWFDVDASGDPDPAGSNVFTGDDVAIEDVDVDLLWAGPDATFGTADDYTYEAAAYGTTTDANGEYLFENLPLGEYRVLVDTSTLPSGMDEATFDADGVVSANQSETTLTVAVPNDLDQDFSYTGSAELGDYVWIDDNGDGIQDTSELPVGGLDVTLYQIDPSDTANPILLATTTTAADGSYLFDNLVAADYVVVFDVLAGHTPTGAHQGASAVDSNGEIVSDATSPFDTMLATSVISLGATESILTLDQGFYLPVSLGDKVWLDTNVDGIQDGNENPVAGVVVNLLDSNGDPVLDGNGAAITTITAADGTYLFDNLPPGSYRVQFVAPTDLGFSPAGQGSDPALDSNAAPTTTQTATAGVTGVITLSSGESDLTIDAGLFDDARIGDRVWEDYDHDGIQDVGEPGVEGVIVLLEGPGPDGIFGNADDVSVASTTTDGSGDYLFSSLVPGGYRVRVDPTTLPTDLVLTIQNAGSGDSAESSDSDANQTSGYMAGVILAAGDVDLTHDAGVFTPYDLAITKTVSDTSVKKNESVTYSLTIANAGPGIVHEPITVTDPLPAGLSFTSVASPDGWNCSEDKDVVTCVTDSTFAADATSTVAIKAKLTANSGTSVLNTAELETPSTPGEVKVASSNVVRVQGNLAITGSESLRLALAGMTLVGLGGLLLLWTRSRRVLGTGS